MDHPENAAHLVGHTKIANDNPISISCGTSFLPFMVDLHTHQTVDVSYNAILDISRDFVRSLLVGCDLLDGLDDAIHRVRSRYFGSSQKALMIALRDVNGRLRDILPAQQQVEAELKTEGIAVTKIGAAKEIKNDELRVGFAPDHMRAYHSAGHSVYVERDAGIGSGFPNEEYCFAGAIVFDTAKEVWDTADMMVKIKESLEAEYQCFHKGLVLYTYLHLAADRPLTDALLSVGAKGAAYETLIERDDSVPLLAPMSQTAGRLSVQEGAKYLEKPTGGSGMLFSGVPGTPKTKAVVLGAGTVGANACKTTAGMGTDMMTTDISLPCLAYLDDILGARIQAIYSTDSAVEKELAQADLVIGLVLIPGKRAPKIVKRFYLKSMHPGSVIVDVAVDQGGCCEIAHVTYYDDSVYTADGVVHYRVGNMPGAVPRTSTTALTNAMLRYGLQIAGNGLEEACRINPVLYSAVNIYNGRCACFNVTDGFGIESYSADQLF